MTRPRRPRWLTDARAAFALACISSTLFFGYGASVLLTSTSPDRMSTALGAAALATVPLMFVAFAYGGQRSSRPVFFDAMPSADATPHPGVPTGSRVTHGRARVFEELASRNVTDDPVEANGVRP